MRLEKLCLLLIVLAVLLAGCETQPAAVPGKPTASEPTTLMVFTAASLTEAFTEIGQRFEAEHPGVKVSFNFAGSQQLAQQLSQGASADVFASANEKQMSVAIEAGRVVSGTQRIFAHNRLVAIYPRDNPAGLKELRDLAKPGLRLVLADKEVPVGRYSLDFLDKAAGDAAFGSAFKEGVLQNVVSYEQTVKAVLSKVALGEGEAGIVFNSDVTGSGADKVGRIDIPDELNVIATYPIAPVADNRNPESAQVFIEFVLGPTGQELLAGQGFISISKE